MHRGYACEVPLFSSASLCISASLRQSSSLFKQSLRDAYDALAPEFERLRLLYRELGVADTGQFLDQFTAGFGNYTEERSAAIEHQTLDEVLAEIYAYQANRSATPISTRHAATTAKNDA